MPFLGPETTLRATIVAGGKGDILRGIIRSLAARQRGPTTYQRLTKVSNDLHQDSTTYEEASGPKQRTQA
jgi:hypothetical protein